uniref:Toxin ETX/toxin MTX2 n=1 Tax=Candidatus Kentrum sp. MB TaxID=2138164 RepID=A0A450XIT6_9GAMM|nr:MAG: toxin ETX/toxin MTX2 [Candidatus Kentron sp. MB]
MIREYLLFSDLSGLDSSPSSVRSVFAKRFGEQPDGIALNDKGKYDSVNPPITERYEYWCYKTLGIPVVSREAEHDLPDLVLGRSVAVNNTDHDMETELAVEGVWANTTSWTSSVTSGMSFSAKFTIKDVFEVGGESSISITSGKSGSKSFSRSVVSTVTVKVPPKSQVKVEMVAKLLKQRAIYTVPIDVSGWFGANFPDSVYGHYFHFLSAEYVLPKTSGEVFGTIEYVTAMDVRIIANKPEGIEAL